MMKLLDSSFKGEYIYRFLDSLTIIEITATESSSTSLSLLLLNIKNSKDKALSTVGNCALAYDLIFYDGNNKCRVFCSRSFNVISKYNVQSLVIGNFLHDCEVKIFENWKGNYNRPNAYEFSPKKEFETFKFKDITASYEVEHLLASLVDLIPSYGSEVELYIRNANKFNVDHQ